MKKNKTKKNLNLIYLSNVFLFYPIYKKKSIKNTMKNKNYFGGNNSVIDMKECMTQGFCAGDYPSTIPKNLEEYTITEFSDNTTTNLVGDLHKTAELNHNLAVGDKNYNSVSPPPKAVFLQK